MSAFTLQEQLDMQKCCIDQLTAGMEELVEICELFEAKIKLLESNSHAPALIDIAAIHKRIDDIAGVRNPSLNEDLGG